MPPRRGRRRDEEKEVSNVNRLGGEGGKEGGKKCEMIGVAQSASPPTQKKALLKFYSR